MITSKLTEAISAIQGIIIQARMLAYEKATHEQIAALLDGCEYLPGLLLEPDDRTIEFGQALRDIAQHFPNCSRVADQFEAS